MYIEFILLIVDYFKTLTRRLIIYEILVPGFIGVVVFASLKNGIEASVYENFRDNSLTLLGVLVGFSITVITILTTGNSRNLEEIKKIKTGLKIGNNEVTLFHLLLTNFTYSVVVEVFLIIVDLIYPLLESNHILSTGTKYIGFSCTVFLVMHVLFLTIRNLTDFYLIIIKK